MNIIPSVHRYIIYGDHDEIWNDLHFHIKKELRKSIAFVLKPQNVGYLTWPLLNILQSLVWCQIMDFNGLRGHQWMAMIIP